MTKKDYELIADSLKNSLYLFKGHNIRTETIEATIHQLAKDLETTNIKFDRTRFLQACGIEG